MLRKTSLVFFAALSILRGQSKALNPLELLEQGRVEESRSMLLQILKTDPNNEPANALLGQIAFDQQDYASAAKRFSKAPAVLKRNPLGKVNYAEALLNTDHGQDAAQLLKDLPADNPEAQFEAGLLLAKFDKFRDAATHFKLTVGYKKPQVAAYNLALAQFRLSEYKECGDTLEKIRGRGYTDEDILNLQGQCAAESGQTDKAFATLKEGVVQNPLDERNYLAISKIAIEEDMAITGIELLDQGLHLMPKSYALLIQRGYLHLSQGQYPEAEADYRTAMTVKPQSPSARIGLAFVLLQNQQLDEAANLLQRIIEEQPSNFFGYYLFGELRIHENHSDDATAYLKKSIALEPNFAASHTELGKILLKKNDAPSAAHEFEQSIQLDPEDTTAYYQLSIAYRRAGEKEKAQTALAKVRDLNEEKRRLGTAKFITERFRKARNRALAPFSE